MSLAYPGNTMSQFLSMIPHKRMNHLFNRRALLLGAGASVLAGCSAHTSTDVPVTSYAPEPPRHDPYYVNMYRAMPDEEFPVPAIDLSQIGPEFLRRQVDYVTPERPGTIIVDPDARFLYLVQEDGMAMRYGVGVGKAGFGWSGRAVIQYKRKWPRWTPTDNMIARDPELEQWRDGMEPGLTNPLGARALYLFENGRDTLYRIHGTNEPWSIGQAMSSGCIRLLNQDIIDLYNRIPNGNPVLVKDSSGPPAIA
jgi:lipoprotein-anchoring transpeptidase ErfK/SrfK